MGPVGAPYTNSACANAPAMSGPLDALDEHVVAPAGWISGPPGSPPGPATTGERRVVHLDQLRPVLGQVPIGRRHHGDRLAGEPHPGPREDGERRPLPLGKEQIGADGQGEAAASSDVSTPITAGESCRRERSTPRISAWAWGLRTKAACTMRGSMMSSRYCVRPSRKRGSSRRTMRCPIDFVAPMSSRDLPLPADRRGQDRPNDVHVARAPADVPRDRLAHVGFGRAGILSRNS